MTGLPKISIVTPSLNQGRFLQHCIDSIAAQDYPNLEHWIIDGGSTDETVAVVERNAARITGYVSEKDEGAADAINKGFARCTGDIVAWLNADDFYLPGALKAVVGAFAATPDAAFIFGNGMRVDEAGRDKALFNPGRPIFNRVALVEGLDYILQPSTFMGAAAMRKAGQLDKGLRYSFDWDLWIRLADHGPVVAIDAVLSASREWGDTLTASGGFRRSEELRRLAERHSGRPMTHGALCYYLDTLLGALRAAGHMQAVEPALLQLWERVQLDMRKLGVDAGGMPLYEEPRAEEPAPPMPALLAPIETPSLLARLLRRLGLR